MKTDTSEAFVNKYADSTLFQGDVCGPIAATMNESMFILVISKWHYAFDGLKETNDYKFLSVSGSLMKNMVTTLLRHLLIILICLQQFLRMDVNILASLTCLLHTYKTAYHIGA